MNKTQLGGLFYPVKNQDGEDIPFDSLFLPYIWKEIYFEGVYIDVLNGKKDMVILDIGANVGMTAAYFRNYAKKVYAMEPDPMHFTALSKNKEFNNWDNVEIFNVALADRDGEMTLSQNKVNQTCNSITNNYGEKSIPVKTVRLDSFLEKNNIDHVDFMKLDVEGADDLVMRTEGFKNAISKIDAVFVEFHHPTWPELAKLMQDFGFKARRYDSSAICVLFFK